jgi:PAS domain S-box-containing protein
MKSPVRMELSFDIRTISLILGITHLIQLIVFIHQYRINRSYKGIGWWVIWSIAELLGFIIILFRNIHDIQVPVIIAYNVMIMAGVVSMYFGIRRFFGKNLNLKIIIPAYSTFFVLMMIFLVIAPDYWYRSASINFFYAFFSLLTAWSLFYLRPKTIRAAANFIGIVCIVHAVVFLYRTLVCLTRTPDPDFFSGHFFNYLPFIDALVVSLFWTFGFIIMVNQRLNVEISEARTELQQIFKTSPDAAIITRLADGMIIDFNEGYTAITGYSREDLSGKTTLDINIWKEIKDREDVVKILKEKGFCEGYEAQFIRKDGVEITGLMSARLIDLNGEPHLISISHDITARKQTEETLRRANAYLENLINYANAPIIVWDSSFTIMRFNRAFEYLTGLMESEVLGRSLEILFPPDRVDISMELIRKTLTGERWDSVEIIIRHRDGSLKTVLWNSATIFDSDGRSPITIAQGQDITLRKISEAMLKLKNEELEETNAEKDKFFSILAHDLRNPFNALLGFTQILDEERNELSEEETGKTIKYLRKATNTIYQLLDNLLEWSRIQRGAVTMQAEPLKLKSLVTETIEVIAESALKKNIDISVNIPENTMVMADYYMLSTIIRNLTGNAVKFTNPGGSVTISGAPTNEQFIEIEVADTGIGIRPEMIDNLFLFNSKTNRQGTSGEPSTGLGLIICKEFAEKQGGGIRIFSEENKGSRFIVSVPGTVS